MSFVWLLKDRRGEAASGGKELQTSAFDVVRPENRATVVAVADLAGMLLGSLSPLVIGLLSDRWGIRGFECGFSLMGGAYLFGAASMAYAALFTFKRDRIVE